MRLRVRKDPQQPTAGRGSRLSPAKRKHCEVEPPAARGRSRMQKNETGLFSTIKKFIRGNAVKVRGQGGGVLSNGTGWHLRRFRTGSTFCSS